MSSGQIRCFVAVEIPTAVKHQLAKIQERNQLPELFWVKPENIHLTIKFLGDIWQSDQPKIEKSLTEIANQYRSFMIKIGSLGAFPNFFQPKVIWAGIEKNRDTIVALAYQINKALVTIGYPIEKRPFIPHVTLARVRPPTVNMQKFSSHQFHEIPPVSVKQISLMQSRLFPSGPVVYNRLSLFSFNSA